MLINGKYTVSELSDMAQYNPKHLKSIIQGHGVSVPLNGRRNVDLIDLACALQDGGKLPDWARTHNDSVMTLSEMVAAGKYRLISGQITEKNFPIDPSRFTTKDHKVYHFHKSMTTAEVKASMRKDGYEPAGMENLLAYGSEFSDRIGKDDIFALAGCWIDLDGDEMIPYLCGNVDQQGDIDEPDLSLLRDNHRVSWATRDKFLARKIVA